MIFAKEKASSESFANESVNHHCAGEIPSAENGCKRLAINRSCPREPKRLRLQRTASPAALAALGATMARLRNTKIGSAQSDGFRGKKTDFGEYFKSIRRRKAFAGMQRACSLLFDMKL